MSQNKHIQNKKGQDSQLSSTESGSLQKDVLWNLFSPHPVPDEVRLAVPILNHLNSSESAEMNHPGLGVISDTILKHICSVYVDESLTNALDSDSDPYNVGLTVIASQVDEDMIKLQKLLKLTELKENFGVIYTAYYRIIRTIIRSKIPQSKAKIGILQLNMPAVVVDGIIKATVDLRNDKVILRGFQDDKTCRWPTITKLKWRVDVIISSGSLGRVMRPNILIKVNAKLYNHRRI